jgi:hypothetical protein
VQLLTLMVDGPDPEPTIHGAIRSFDGTDESRRYFGWAAFANEAPPVFAGAGLGSEDEESPEPAFVRVWRDGTRVRIENPDGRPSLIVGDETCWQFDADHEARSRGGPGHPHPGISNGPRSSTAGRTRRGTGP